MTKKPNHFVDNEELYRAFVEYRSRPEVKDYFERKARWREARAAGKRPGKFTELPPDMPETIKIAVWLIANNFARKPNWRHLPYIEDMIGDAVVGALRYAASFDPQKSENPFAYITQIVSNTFLMRIHEEKVQARLAEETIARASVGQIQSFEGDAQLVSTEYATMMMSHYDEVHILDELKNGGKVKKKPRKVKNQPKESTGGVLDL